MKTKSKLVPVLDHSTFQIIVQAKKPNNAFFLYRKEHVETIKLTFGVSKSHEVSKKAAEMWKNEPDDVKRRYQTRAAEEFERHKMENPNYVWPSRANSSKPLRRVNKKQTPVSGPARPETAIGNAQAETAQYSPAYYYPGTGAAAMFPSPQLSPPNGEEAPVQPSLPLGSDAGYIARPSSSASVDYPMQSPYAASEPGPDVHFVYSSGSVRPYTNSPHGHISPSPSPFSNFTNPLFLPPFQERDPIEGLTLPAAPEFAHSYPQSYASIQSPYYVSTSSYLSDQSPPDDPNLPGFQQDAPTTWYTPEAEFANFTYSHDPTNSVAHTLPPLYPVQPVSEEPPAHQGSACQDGLLPPRDVLWDHDLFEPSHESQSIDSLSPLGVISNPGSRASGTGDAGGKQC
ncbi:hypothetical protein HDU91_007436 [Kappamyces sp. JEL0680]|nr:hypothetical protein HDU91_007436 [Kappamyces sp. JEL0680]